MSERPESDAVEQAWAAYDGNHAIGKHLDGRFHDADRAKVAEAIRAEAVKPWREAVRTSIVRFEILAGRMHARDVHDGRVGDNESGYSHELSRFEIGGWIDGLRALLDRDSEGP